MFTSAIYILHGVQKKNKNDICPFPSCAQTYYLTFAEIFKARRNHFLDSLNIINKSIICS